MTIKQIIEHGLKREFKKDTLFDGTQYQHLGYSTTSIRIITDNYTELLAIDNTLTRVTVQLNHIDELYFTDTVTGKILCIRTNIAWFSITL